MTKPLNTVAAYEAIESGFDQVDKIVRELSAERAALDLRRALLDADNARHKLKTDSMYHGLCQARTDFIKLMIGDL